MKANALLLFPPLLLPVILAACSSQPKPAPVLPPPPIHLPAHPRPHPPISVTPPPADWRDAIRSPGDWSWSRDGTRSVARYGGNLALACDSARGQITLLLGVQASPDQIVIVTTTSQRRALSGVPQGAQFVVSLPANDPLLDAMAFSRGRFMVETGGNAPLYVPSWPELGRVIEDCR